MLYTPVKRDFHCEADKILLQQINFCLFPKAKLIKKVQVWNYILLDFIFSLEKSPPSSKGKPAESKGNKEKSDTNSTGKNSESDSSKHKSKEKEKPQEKEKIEKEKPQEKEKPKEKEKPELEEKEYYITAPFTSVKDSLALFSKDPLVHKPGNLF